MSLRALIAGLVLLALSVRERSANCQEEVDKSAKALKSAIQRGDSSGIKSAGAALAKIGDAKACLAVVDGLLLATTEHYWPLFEFLMQFRSRDALSSVARRALELGENPIALDLVIALCRHPEKEAEIELRFLLEKGTGQIRRIVIEELLLRGGPDAMAMLVDILEESEKKGDKETEFKRRVLLALQSLTGRNFPDGASWRKWWTESQSTTEIPGRENGKPSGDTIVSGIKRDRKSQYDELKKGEKGRILVVKGSGDQVEDVLLKLDIPHSFITLKRISEGLLDPKDTLAVLINCGAEAAVGGVGGKNMAENVRRFVEAGGYLFCSDRSFDLVLRKTFEQYLKPAPLKKEGAVGILPERGSLAHPFLRHVFPANFSATWDVEGGSAGFVATSAKTSVLVMSPDLVARGNPGGVAACFEHGSSGGTVLYLLSHFSKQKTRDDEFTLQNMLLNFLIEAQETYRERSK